VTEQPFVYLVVSPTGGLLAAYTSEWEQRAYTHARAAFCVVATCPVVADYRNPGGPAAQEGPLLPSASPVNTPGTDLSHSNYPES
jgi:hypothetical protein